MIVNNNISFETVNCACCTKNMLARVPNHVLDDTTTSNVTQHVCQKYAGTLTKQIADYMSKRIEYKQRAKEKDISGQAREYRIILNAYKILINSAYRQLGHSYSKYENVKAAS